MLMTNQAYLRMFGFASTTELEGRPLLEQIAPQCRAQVEENVRRREQGKEAPRAYEIVGLKKDGSQFPFYVESALIELPDGPAILGYFADITERKLGEEALKQSEEQYRSLVVNLDDVIFTINAEGHITYISPVVERFAGYKAEEIIGQPFMSYIHPDDRQSLLESFRRSLGGQAEPAEFRILRKDGASLYVRSLSRALAENGQVSLTGILSDITERKQAEDELRESHAKLAKTFEQTVVSLASIAEMRDPYTAGHQVRVAGLACRIASEIGMSAEQIGAIRTAALLHDIGKIIVPPEIWNKPGKLNVIERSFVEGHAQASYDILKTIDFEFPIAEIVRQHHEKLDGSGYPQGLSGDSILKEARILTVADIVEAMASHRPYRPALPLKVALEEIGSHRGTLYDADAVDACLRLFSRKGFKQSVWH
jgi:PAS domain S-box-containing protein/putative nucleotidyltransferase with HDIG domain